MKYLKTYEQQNTRELIYILNTEAITITSVIDNKIFKYKVYILVDNSNDKLVLKFGDTPGEWYVDTILEHNNNLLSIIGDYWVCINFKDIRQELIKMLPFLEKKEMLKKAKKFNL